MKSFKPTTLKDVIGSTGYTGTAKSLADMKKAVARGVTKETLGRELTGLDFGHGFPDN